MQKSTFKVSTGLIHNRELSRLIINIDFTLKSALFGHFCVTGKLCMLVRNEATVLDMEVQQEMMFIAPLSIAA